MLGMFLVYPTELDTAAALTEAASGSEEEGNNTISSANFFHAVWWLFGDLGNKPDTGNLIYQSSGC